MGMLSWIGLGGGGDKAGEGSQQSSELLDDKRAIVAKVRPPSVGSPCVGLGGDGRKGPAEVWGLRGPGNIPTSRFLRHHPKLAFARIRDARPSEACQLPPPPLVCGTRISSCPFVSVRRCLGTAGLGHQWSAVFSRAWGVLSPQ